MNNPNFRESVIIEVEIENRARGYIKLWFSDSDAIYGDAVIGYSIYDGNQGATDGGEMDYDTSEKDYSTIEDAIPDIIDFAFGDKITDWDISDIDPDSLD